MWIFVILILFVLYLKNYMWILLVSIFLLYIIRKKSCNKNEIVKTLLRQSARWSVAAKQDTNPIIAVLHANYGAAYLWALLDIIKTSDIKGVDMIRFKKDITDIQDSATQNMIKLCPNIQPDNSYLSIIAGENKKRI